MVRYANLLHNLASDYFYAEAYDKIDYFYAEAFLFLSEFWPRQFTQ